MYFQLEVEYYSNEANKNKYTNFQVIASTKNNLKQVAQDQIVQGIVLATTTCYTLLFRFESAFLLDLFLLEIIFFKRKLCQFEQGISRSHQCVYVNKSQ